MLKTFCYEDINENFDTLKCKGHLFVFDHDLILKFKCHNNYTRDFCWMNWHLDFMNKV